ncbi:hypothetical protein [Streptomyces sp. NPDC001816]|uniref:hypothetical protein n=1 Tax=Streptomyces sp. NPDC001816 TaxID=3364612 RepID=UPI00367665EA
MSDYYDLFLAVDLRPDLPEAFLRELAWLAGRADPPPAFESADWALWGDPWQVLAGGEASHSFDGADTSLLVRAENRRNADGGVPWALTARVCIHEDEFGVLMEVLEWVLREAVTEGWAGFLRNSGTEEVQHIVRSRAGFDIVNMRAAGRLIQVSWA